MYAYDLINEHQKRMGAIRLQRILEYFYEQLRMGLGLWWLEENLKAGCLAADETAASAES